MLQGCRLFKQSRNLPAGHCVAEVQAVSAEEFRLLKGSLIIPVEHCDAGVQAV